MGVLGRFLYNRGAAEVRRSNQATRKIQNKSGEKYSRRKDDQCRKSSIRKV